jgi:hypothetical protein
MERTMKTPKLFALVAVAAVAVIATAAVITMTHEVRFTGLELAIADGQDMIFKVTLP